MANDEAPSRIAGAEALSARSGVKVWRLDIVPGENFALVELPAPRSAAASSDERLRLTVKWAGLTTSELEVLEAILAGLSNSEIARQRGTNVRTIANQAASIYRKLRVQSRLQLRAVLAAASKVVR